MAQIVRTVVDLVDDITGRPAVETIEYTWEGQELVIDLSAAHAKRFRKQMQHWVAYSRLAKANGKRSKPTPADLATDDAPEVVTAAVREWAKANGFKVKDTGKLSAEVIDAYDKRGKGK